MSKKLFDYGNLITIIVLVVPIIGGFYVMQNDIEHLEKVDSINKADADRVHGILLSLIKDRCK